MELRLSRYGAASVPPAPVNAMMAAFAEDFRDGIDINLGVGYVNERTIPGPLMLEAMEAVLADPATYRQAFNYGGPRGSRNLIESLRRFLVSRRLGGLDAEILAQKEIIIGPSGATSLLDAISDVFAPGLVITADPMYYIYCNALERKGFQVAAVPEDADGIDPRRVETFLETLGAAAKDIAFFYLVTVNNPTCSVLSNDRRRGIVEIASRLSRAQNRLVPVFFDQAYEFLLHDPEAVPFVSGMIGDEQGVVYELGTLSKVLAPALRVGYLIGPPGAFIEAMVQKTSDVGFSAPLFAQGMAAYLLDHHIGGQMGAVNAGYRRKAVETKRLIDDCLGAYLDDCRGGRAGFYYYLTFRDIETHTSSAFFRFLTRTTGDPDIDGPAENKNARVIYIPGQYCVHPRGSLVGTGRRQLRLSYGFEELTGLERAIHLMGDAARYAQAPRDAIHA